MPKLCAWVLVWLGISLSAGADIYRCVDRSGRVHFTDAPAGCEIAQPVVLERIPEPAPSCGEAEFCALPASPATALATARVGALPASFLAASELGPDWSTLDETAEPIDPELRRQGLVDAATRHYTRSAGRVSEVCTLELWQFGQAETAAAVAASLSLPHWQVLRAESLLVLAHGARLELSVRSDVRLSDACAQIGQLTLERISPTR